MEAPRSTYSYTPLNEDRREIRLLHLLPRGQTTMGTTSTQGLDLVSDVSVPTMYRCSLSVVSLNDTPSFEALSYAWGDTQGVELVLLDGHEFPVTANLHIALTHLQHPDEGRIIWIDALCINQGDGQERTSQVAQMVDVFSMASSVIAFLGTDWEGCNIMMEYMAMIGNDPTLHFDPEFEHHVKCRGMDMLSEDLQDHFIRFF